MAKQVKIMEIPAIQLKRIIINVEGTAPLIVHAWSKKAKEEMLNKQMKKAGKGKEAKNPNRDFLESLYWLDEKNQLIQPGKEVTKKSRFGFPAIGFKACAVNAANDVGLMKTAMRRAFHIDCEYVVIQGLPDMREDMVRLNGQTADIRYRGEFKKWKASIPVIFNPTVISSEQIFNLFNLAGFGVGVGEWRPEKNGSYGTFRVI